VLYSRIYKSIITLLLTFVFIQPVMAASFDVSERVEEFLSEIPAVSETTCEKLLNKLSSDNKWGFFSVAEDSGALYSLAVVQLKNDDDVDVALELESAVTNVALLKARERLAFYIGQGNINRNLYRYEDALAKALLNYYTRPDGRKIIGIETAASMIKNSQFVAGLAWISSDTAELLGKDIPQPGTLDNDYCCFLYHNRALNLFEAKRYSEALPLFKNIHDLRWADIDAYLDAAECFLRTEKSKDCLKLLHELQTTLERNMNSDELMRTGKLFREAGDKQSATLAFKAARVRYHEENATLSKKISH